MKRRVGALRRLIRRATDRSWLVLGITMDGRTIARPFRRRNSAFDCMDNLAPRDKWAELSLLDLSWIPNR